MGPNPQTTHAHDCLGLAQEAQNGAPAGADTRPFALRKQPSLSRSPRGIRSPEERRGMGRAYGLGPTGLGLGLGGGYCRLQMSLKLALAVRGTVAGHRLGALGWVSEANA